MTKILIQTHLYQEPADGYIGSFCLRSRPVSPNVVCQSVSQSVDILNWKIPLGNTEKNFQYIHQQVLDKGVFGLKFLSFTRSRIT